MTVLLTSLLALSVSCAVVSAKCTEGDTAPIEGKCKEFQVCKDGEWVTDSCNTWLRKYSREQKKCDWWFKVDCDELSRCSEEGEILRNPLTCSSYYKCESGKLISHQCIWPFYFDGTGCRFWASCEAVGNNQSVKYADLCTGDESEPIADHCFWYKTCGKDGVFEQTRCSYGKQFNVTTKTCDWFWKVDCSISTCDGKARATEPNGKTYYQCSNGFLMKKTCGPLQKFDVEKERCVFASPFSAVQLESVRNTIANVTDLANDADVRQVEEILRNLAQQEPNAVPTATDKAPLPIVRASNSSVLLRRLRRADGCTSGLFAVDPNCLDYKECVSGSWVSKRCPDHMIFSNNQCRWGWEATCDPKSCIKGTNKVYPSDCTKYLHCDDNNNQVVTDCPGKWLLIKYRFNPKSSSCEKVWRWESCPSSSYLMTCPEGGEFNPKTEMCEKKKTKRSVGNNPADCISGDTKC